MEFSAPVAESALAGAPCASLTGVTSVAEGVYGMRTYPDTGLYISECATYQLAVKAGNNDDSHNHNDVGSFILFKQGAPFIIDIGVETYSKKTFSPERYEIWTMHFHCGTMGAGHGHSDQLHVDFSANGEDILVDSGRFTYVSKRERYDYKNPPAHNTITVDGVDYCHWTDSWGADSFCKPINFKSVSVDGYCYCEGGHTGYLVANDVTGCKGGVLVNRRVLFIKPDIVLFVDEFISTNNVENSSADSAFCRLCSSKTQYSSFYRLLPEPLQC